MSKEDEEQSIPIAWVSKDDLIRCRPDYREAIEAMTEGDLEHLGRKVGDALQTNYWIALEVMMVAYLSQPVEKD